MLHVGVVNKLVGVITGCGFKTLEGVNRMCGVECIRMWDRRYWGVVIRCTKGAVKSG